MSSNFERLQNSSRRQMEAFIRSIVSKRASAFIDWHAWLSSDDPDVTFLGEDAIYKNDDGSERECRFLKEETDEDGLLCRHIYFFDDDGDVTDMKVRADRVRKLTEDTFPVVEEPIDFFTAPVQVPKEAAAPAEVPAADDFDFDSFIESELNEAADQVQTAEDEITGRIIVQEKEAAAQALEDKPFTDLQNIDPDADDELPDVALPQPEEPEAVPEPEPVIPVTEEPKIPAEPEPVPEIPAEPEPMKEEPESTDFLDYQPQLEEFDQAMEDIENTMQVEMQDVPLDEEDEPIGELLQTLKERSALYDPNNQEDHELPTIAFTAIAEDKLVNNE